MEKKTLQNLAKDEGLISCNNLFFQTGSPNIENFDFFKRYGALYDLLIDLLNEKITIDDQNNHRFV